jgi:hypothetical protein
MFTQAETMKHKKGMKMQVTTRAVIQRINRRLKPDAKQLCVTRGERMLQSIGYYHIMDYSSNYVSRPNVDPETLARELGVLGEHEEMVE